MPLNNSVMRLLLSILSSLLGLCAWAQTAAAFPEAGKVYLLHRYSKANGYMYEQGNKLQAGPASNTQKQYWEFIPTGNDNCYYLRNVTSRRYVQSTHISLSQQVSTGEAPVEFKVAACTANNAQKGYYYLCSTDQTINTAADGTLGLNFSEATGKVVAYHITNTRANSYWEILETSYDYVAPEPPVHTPLAQRLGIYYLPCGTAGSAYLTAVDISGQPDAAAVHYSATSAPAAAFLLNRNQEAVVHPDSTLTLTYAGAGFESVTSVTAYFDWNADGLFEQTHDFFGEAEGRLSLTVPATVALDKRLRLRLRVTDNGLEGAEDEVYGTTYDFYLRALPSSAPPSGIATPLAATPADYGGIAYTLEGLPVQPDKAKGIYIHQGKKRIR